MPIIAIRGREPTSLYSIRIRDCTQTRDAALGNRRRESRDRSGSIKNLIPYMTASKKK